MHYDFDWLVIGSGFGGSVSALRLAQKGYRVGVLECGRRFTDDEFPKSTWDLRRYLVRAAARAQRDLPADDLQGRRDRVRAAASAAGRSATRTRSTARPPRFYEDPQWAGLDDWQVALAPHYDEAERMLGVPPTTRTTPPTTTCASTREEIGVGGHLRQDARGRVPRRAGRDRAGSVLRRRRAGPHRLPALRALHGRLPARRQEHARRRTTCGSPSARACGSCRSARSSTSGRSAHRRRDGYAVTSERSGAWVRAATADADRARRRRRRRRARHQPAAGGVQAQRLAPEALATGSASSCARTREAILAVTLPRRRARLIRRAWRSPARSTPTPDTHIETVVYGDAGDSDVAHLHAADRRRHARSRGR